MNIQEQIAVMQHFANGGEIEQDFVGDNAWYQIKNPKWDWSTFNYRVKAAPKKKMYQWLMKTSKNELWATSEFYETEHEVKKQYTTSKPIQPLLYTEIEV